MIPPDQDAEFVAHMEDVLDLYHRAYDPHRPLVCMDEQPRQLIQEARRAQPMRPGAPIRYDAEYARQGTAVTFLFTEPLAAWRKVRVRAQKTRVDWAWEIKDLLDHDYPEADVVILVCDNLNIHTIASLYAAFDPVEARRLTTRLEIHHTPKHGSWLNIAEIELSALSRQGLAHRIPNLTVMQRQAGSWERERNANQKTVDWQFTTDEARIKLKRLYPQF